MKDRNISAGAYGHACLERRTRCARGKGIRRGLQGTLFAICMVGTLLWGHLGMITSAAAESGQEAVPAELSDSAVSMDVTYGYQNTAKRGRYLPLTVDLKNSGEEDFHGVLRVKSLEPDFQGYNGRIEYDTYEYEYPIEIPASGQIRSEFSVSLGNGVDQMYVTLLDQEEREVVKKRLKLNLNMDTAELFIGILSDTPDRLLYFDNVGIHYSTLRTRTIEMSADTLPASEMELDQLDVLLINDFDTGELSRDQVNAVWEWVQEGGLLLFGMGARGEDTIRAFGQELVEYPLPQPETYEVNMGVEYAVDSPEQSAISLVCTDVSLIGGSEFVSSDELSVVSGVAVGNGMAAAAIYDFGDIEEFCRNNISYVDKLFTTLLGEERINRLTGSMDSSGSSQFWAVQGLITSGDISSLPKVGLYACLAIAYVILVGPGLYFFLKQRGLGIHYHAAVVILSVCCTGMVLLMGTVTRFEGPFFTYATILDADADGISETSYVNMRSPYNKPYSVEIDPSYSLYPLTGSPYYGGQPYSQFTGEEAADIRIRYGEESTCILAGNVGAFNSKLFRLERWEQNREGKGFTGNISVFDGKITGTLTNNYGQPVEDAAVILYNQMVLIDRMEPGETVQLDGRDIIYGSTNYGYAMASQITGTSRYQEDGDIEDSRYAEALQRTNLLSFYIENYLSDYHAQARVTAFSRNQEETGFLRDGDYDTYGCTLLTSSVDVNYEKDGRIYRSALQKEPDVVSGEYYVNTNTMYGSAPVVLEYYLGNDLEVEKLSFYSLSQEMEENLRYYYVVPFVGTMYFYNYNTGNYDPMDPSRTEYDGESLAPYLSPGNTLTVKYAYDGAGDYTWNIMLPVLTVTGRSK